jgi:TrmH family RNA methyltransferase
LILAPSFVIIPLQNTTMALTRKEIQDLKALKQKKVRGERGLFVAEGFRFVNEAAESDFEFVTVLHTAEMEDDPAGAGLLRVLAKRSPVLVRVTARELAAVGDTVTSQGILAVVRRKGIDAERILSTRQTPAIVVAFDAVADPGNLGTMVRTCDWFGIAGILLGSNCVELYNPKALRATMGSVFHLPVAADVHLPRALVRAKELGYRVYVTDAAGDVVHDRSQIGERSLLVFGNEARGVSEQVRGAADGRLAIPRYGRAESLNVGVACGIVLAQIRGTGGEP